MYIYANSEASEPDECDWSQNGARFLPRCGRAYIYTRAYRHNTHTPNCFRRLVSFVFLSLSSGCLMCKESIRNAPGLHARFGYAFICFIFCVQECNAFRSCTGHREYAPGRTHAYLPAFNLISSLVQEENWSIE